MPDSNTPLFSLMNGEGAGVMLGAAAGDVAGGNSPIGYSALTQQATIVAYHLLRNDGIDRALLAEEWKELAADNDNPTVYRGTSASFLAWLEAFSRDEGAATVEPSSEPAARVYPIGVWFRRDPGRLISASIALARITHIDAASVVGAAAVAGAVAASSFGQVGRDLLIGAAELVERAIAEVAVEDYLYSRMDDARRLPEHLRSAASWVSSPGVDLMRKVLDGGPPSVAEAPVVAIVLASSPSIEPYRLIEAAATLGGSELATIVGSMVGGRVGLKAWPWVVPNSTWFAEIGRRLVSSNRETRDIPVPYQVEERLTFGLTPGWPN